MTTLRIEPVTGPPAEDYLRSAFAVRDAVLRAIAPADPAVPFDQWAGHVRHVPSGRRQWHWLTDGGYATLVAESAATAGRAAVFVVPSARRQGRGTVLLDRVRRSAAQAGCRTILAEVGDAAGAAFARAHGATTGNTTIRSLLRLPVVLESAPVPGFHLLSWTGAAPGSVLESYAAARNAIHDAPHSDQEPDVQWTAQLVRDLESAVAKRDRQVRVTAALAGPEVAGFTELRVSAPDGSIASTEDTAVLPQYRGRGIASWLKAESLIHLQRDRLDVAAVRTANDAGNVPMLAVNRAVGFRPVSSWTDVVLTSDQHST